MNDGLVITVLVCVLAVIVNIIALIILAVMCRRRRRQRARTAVVLETDPTYHDAEVFEELNYENARQYRDEGGYEIPVPPPYTYTTQPGGSGTHYHNDPEAVWRKGAGTYLLEIRPDGQKGNSRKGSRDGIDQILDMDDPGKLQPRVELTLALYHTSDT